MNLLERLGLKDPGLCDWSCAVCGNFCNEKDGHKSPHFNDALPLCYMDGKKDCIWTVSD